MLDGQHNNGFATIMKAHAVIANPQPQFGRFHILKAFYVSIAGGKISGNCIQNTERSCLIDRAQIGLQVTFLLPTLTGPDAILVREACVPCARSLPQ